MTRRPSKASILSSLLLLVLFYFGVAHFVYGLRHPELTGTQRFLATLDAMLWR